MSSPTSDALGNRPATTDDWPAIWAALEPAVRAGDTLALPRDMGEAAARAYWFGDGHAVFVAAAAGRVVGSYYLRANQAGGGDHVANAGYVVHPDARGRGVARAMAVASFDAALARGFRAMQFNIVVSTNIAAVALWRSVGFAVVGTLPGAFRHPVHGAVDALVLFRRLP
jgi:L-amino acid N-acyltransferase YncA